jgi:hypothetical protein
MNTVKFIISLLMVAGMASCITVPVTPPPFGSQEKSNILGKDTKIRIDTATQVTMPRGSYIKTDEDLGVDVVLQEDTKAEVLVDAEKGTSKTALILPKNTKLSLPPNTSLKIPENTTVRVEKETLAVLPKGTEVIVSKINWYAIAFYGILIAAAAWWYMSGRVDQDKDGDGYEDVDVSQRKQDVSSEK